MPRHCVGRLRFAAAFSVVGRFVAAIAGTLALIGTLGCHGDAGGEAGDGAGRDSLLNSAIHLPGEKSTAEVRLRPEGATGLLSSVDGRPVLMTADHESYQRLAEASRVNNLAEIQKAIKEGKAWPVQGETKFEVIKNVKTEIEVKILDGPLAGKTGIVAREWVR